MGRTVAKKSTTVKVSKEERFNYYGTEENNHCNEDNQASLNLNSTRRQYFIYARSFFFFNTVPCRCIICFLRYKLHLGSYYGCGAGESTCLCMPQSIIFSGAMERGEFLI